MKEAVDIKAIHVSLLKSGTTFTVVKGKTQMKLKTFLLGPQQAENILPGIYLALHLGISKESIIDAVSTLRPLSNTMIRKKLQNGTMTLDCTFNVNPRSITTIVEYMKLYKGKKILVMQPMIELGEHGKLEHYKVGVKVSNVCDFLLLTNNNFLSDMKRGVADGGGKCVVAVGSRKSLAELIKRKTSKGTDENIVAFLSKESGGVLAKLL